MNSILMLASRSYEEDLAWSRGSADDIKIGWIEHRVVPSIYTWMHVVPGQVAVLMILGKLR